MKFIKTQPLDLLIVNLAQLFFVGFIFFGSYYYILKLVVGGQGDLLFAGKNNFQIFQFLTTSIIIPVYFFVSIGLLLIKNKFRVVFIYLMAIDVIYMIFCQYFSQNIKILSSTETMLKFVFDLSLTISLLFYFKSSRIKKVYQSNITNAST